MDNSRKILRLHFKLEEQMNAWDMIYIYSHVFNQNLHSPVSWPKPELGFYRNVFDFSMELGDSSGSVLSCRSAAQTLPPVHNTKSENLGKNSMYPSILQSDLLSRCSPSS